MPRLAVIVLAAGRSSRFAVPGRHKLLAPMGGAPVVSRSVRAAVAAAVGDVVVVTGCEAAGVEATLRGLAVRPVHAPDFADGIAASLRAGIEAVRHTADAAIIALGDQPFVRPAAYRHVAAAWQRTGAALVVPRYERAPAPAHPLLIAAALYDEVLALRGDVGARALIGADPSRVLRVDLDWPSPRDVDTPDDLAAMAAAWRAAQPPEDS